jgi:linoleoyl-CoA desaturase
METSKQKLKFRKNNSNFYQALNEKVKNKVSIAMRKKAQRLMYIKFTFYSLIFVLSYIYLFKSYPSQHPVYLILNYIVLGLSGILLAFNASHDAVHGTFSKYRYLNQMVYYITFNLQGVNANLWRKRHIASHHLFPNVDGCDADIDDNPFIRLSLQQEPKLHHRLQHIYAPLLYTFYTLHWILIKDFIYLFKKSLANLHDLNWTFKDLLELLLWKAIYFSYMIVIPMLYTDHTWIGILLSFFIMHLIISLFFVFTLIISHLCMETEFPMATAEGQLPYTFHEHQLAVSLDYNPTSKLANWIFGGFNAHSAHHLFPKMPHTLYATITPLIKETAHEYNLPYHELSMHKAIYSHLRYLKAIGKP